MEVFRDKVTQELKSNLTTTNKKVQKRKIKKLKQKEQQLEREREEKLLQEQRAQKDENVIKVQHAQAIELLIGKQPEGPEQEPTVTWTDQQTEQIKQKKKNKKKKKPDANQKEESPRPKEEYKIEGIKTVKPATPKSKAPTQTVMSSQSKVDP